MSIVVEHDKRKHEILQKALDVFIDEGYNDVTLQKIADRCGITRTTLYRYFSNKQEVFLWSIKELLFALNDKILAILNDDSLSAEQALRAIMNKVIDICQENYKLFRILLPYLIQVKKSGGNPGEKVRRRVIKLRHRITTVLIRGIQNGEFKEEPIHEMNNMLYGLIESAIFKVAVLCEDDILNVKSMIEIAINGILKK